MEIGSFVSLGILTATLIYGIVIYNSLVNLKHGITKAWANIDVLLKQRHDELPKLVGHHELGYYREPYLPCRR